MSRVGWRGRRPAGGAGTRGGGDLGRFELGRDHGRHPGIDEHRDVPEAVELDVGGVQAGRPEAGGRGGPHEQVGVGVEGDPSDGRRSGAGGQAGQDRGPRTELASRALDGQVGGGRAFVRGAQRHRRADVAVTAELLDVPPQQDAAEAVGDDMDARGAGQRQHLVHPAGQPAGQRGDTVVQGQVVEPVDTGEPRRSEVAVEHHQPERL